MIRVRPILTFLGLFVLLPVAVLAGMEPPLVEWERKLGGEFDDYGRSVQQTSGGGYIVAGWTESFGAGWSDVYLVKTDEHGDEEWYRTFGGELFDRGLSVEETSGGGYIVAGSTKSFGAVRSDVYVIRTDANGIEVWSETFGGWGYDSGYSVQQTTDDGFVIAGTWAEHAGPGMSDMYLIKTDADGNEDWSKLLAGGDVEIDYWGRSVQQTSDGGYIVCGGTKGMATSFVSLIKTDHDGNREWEGMYADWGGEGYSVQQTSDGGYVVVGEYYSFDGGADDAGVYLLKTDMSGNEMWAKGFGGEGIDRGYSVQQTRDGGYITAGQTFSFGGGQGDVYLIKTDGDGIEEWSTILGGDLDDCGYSVQQTDDEGCIVAGSTTSAGGDSDVYLVKLTPDPVPFMRGRTNTDAELDISDAICLLSYLFGAEDDPCKEIVPRCLDAADANDDGTIDIADGVSILSHLFVSAGDLPEPFAACGYDETHDDLRCFEFQACR